MDASSVLPILGEMFRTGLTVAMPVLVVALVVGLAISILQVATQIQEMTLTFVPKIIMVVVVLGMFGNWMLTTLVDYARTLFTSIGTM